MENYSLMTNEMIEQIKQVMMQARANVAQTLPDLSKIPDSVWKIELVPLL